MSCSAITNSFLSRKSRNRIGATGRSPAVEELMNRRMELPSGQAVSQATHPRNHAANQRGGSGDLPVAPTDVDGCPFKASATDRNWHGVYAHMGFSENPQPQLCPAVRTKLGVFLIAKTILCMPELKRAGIQLHNPGIMKAHCVNYMNLRLYQ